MDASNYGLCVLNSSSRRYVAVTFDEEERHHLLSTSATVVFDINVRERICVAYVCVFLGASWSTQTPMSWPHGRCWTDNHTALARTNNLASNNTFAQELNRCIGLAEAAYRFRVSAEHLPGAVNTIADAGSRLNDAVSSTANTTQGVQDILHQLQAANWPTAPEPPVNRQPTGSSTKRARFTVTRTRRVRHRLLDGSHENGDQFTSDRVV
ncbi:hypothetical protein PHPALM_30622 [Phytophthora palmivora]|uniref:Uncharacterized protein n=1 Tax=Phytophthora palmivora TaxID=4796 RepID=A0A2P4X4P4_9STRA|nr:hypothetical protein PHPALM_30622 [Phytophthora palmivora]